MVDLAEIQQMGDAQRLQLLQGIAAEFNRAEATPLNYGDLLSFYSQITDWFGDFGVTIVVEDDEQQPESES